MLKHLTAALAIGVRQARVRASIHGICLVLGIVLAPVQDARSWGPEGHSIVAEIAQRRMTPTALAKIKELLGGEVSLASVASWADDIRLMRPKTYNEHFVDIPLGATNYDPARDCEDTPKGDCAINAIERNRRTLADSSASPQERREALLFLVHFIGDIHQPLHTVKEYVGGNEFPVNFFSDPSKRKKEATNLHVVWDVLVIRATVWAWGSYVTQLVDEWLPGKDLETLAAGTPIEWVLDAHQAAIDVAFKAEPDADLGEDYLAMARPVVDRQLALAGLRLARVLNDTLK